LYDDMETTTFSTTLSSSLGLPLPNPAPDVDLVIKAPGTQRSNTKYWYLFSLGIPVF
jgi:hypothetical protein